MDKIVPVCEPCCVSAKPHLVTWDSLNERSDIEVYCEFFLFDSMTIQVLYYGLKLTPR
jgi:hypothetical protein